MSLRIQVIGVNQAIKNIEKYIQRKHLGLLGAVIESSQAITSEAKSLAPVDLGDLRADINYTVTDGKNLIEGNVLSAAPYSAYVEWGSRPHRPPAKALEGWAERHGVPLGAVLRKIEREGTPASPFMLPAAMKIKPKFIRGVRRVMSSP